MKDILQMFISFFKIGAFTFGGGYAMIPLIEEEMVSNKKWIEKDEFVDIVAIAQSFPGALAVNTSIFTGYKVQGILGAVAALLGTALPSFMIILLVASVFLKFRENYYVEQVFKGINGAVPVLVLVAIFSISKSIKRNYLNLAIIIAALILLQIFNVNPVVVIIFSGVFGVFYYREKVEK